MTHSANIDNIYLTCKTRMVSEAKLRATGKLYNLLITWYAFWLIVLSLVDLLGIYKIPYSDFIFTACSIATFGLSLLVYGERHFEKAEEFRNCYLSLQKIYRSASSDENKIRRYFEVLELYPNQSDDDYDEMVFMAHLRKQRLYNAAGDIKCAFLPSAKVVARKILKFAYWIGLFVLPAMPFVAGTYVPSSVNGTDIGIAVQATQRDAR